MRIVVRLVVAWVAALLVGFALVAGLGLDESPWRHLIFFVLGWVAYLVVAEVDERRER